MNVSDSLSQSRKRKRQCHSDAERNTYLENRYRSLIPGPVLTRKRENLIEKIQNLVESRFPNSKVRVYGSSLSNTALISSDIDFGVYVDTENVERTVDEIMVLLRTGEFRGIEKRRSATHDRIGIFGYDEDENKVRTYIDLTVNNKIARKAGKLIRSLVDIHSRVKTLMVLIKEFSRCFSINDQRRGTLASIGYSYMVVFVLQVNNILPKFVNRNTTSEFNVILAEADAFKVRFDEVSQQSGNTSTLQLLHTFFQYYNQVHDFSKDAISILGGQVVSKQSLEWGGGEQKYCLAIVDPFGVENVGRTVSFEGLEKIKEAFQTAENILQGSKPHDLFKPLNPQ